MKRLSERAYAAHSGLSREAVQKARRNGRLVLFADGSINAAGSDARPLLVGDWMISGPGATSSYNWARTAGTRRAFMYTLIVTAEMNDYRSADLNGRCHAHIGCFL